MVLPMGFMARRRMRFDTAPGAINNNARKGKRKDMPPVDYRDASSVSVASATEAKRTPDVILAIQVLADRVGDLNKMAEELTDRLGSVLSPEFAGKALGSASSGAPVPARCQMADQIGVIFGKADEAADKLRSILNRLEV